MFPLFLMILLAGCTTAGDWVSGSAAHRDPALAYPKQLDRVQIGVTTKDEVRNLLGPPTDVRLSPDQTQASESWAYAKADPAIHPMQYIPGLGGFMLSKHRRQASFSISFSSHGIVDGIVLGDVQPVGESGASKVERATTAEPYPYGRNNPLTRQRGRETASPSETSGE